MNKCTRNGKAILVGGIDTGVGKTVVCGLMARYLLARGVNAITVKMVQTGNVGFSEDLNLHRAMMGRTFPEDALGLTAPQIFSFPASPLMASRLDGKTVDVDRIAQCVTTLQSRYDVVLIEAAGGLAVPLTEDLLTVDFAAAQGWQLILVSSGKLGSVNHTVLSLESALARGLDVLGVAYNYCPDADPAIDRDSAQYITQYMRKKGLPPTGSVPDWKRVAPKSAYSEVKHHPLRQRGSPPALSVVPKVDLSQIPDGLPNVDFSALFDSILEIPDSCNNHDK